MNYCADEIDQEEDGLEEKEGVDIDGRGDDDDEDEEGKNLNLLRFLGLAFVFC